MGAYAWMDIALGSDTGGSIRGPSGANGCFGNRPSHGLVSLDNVMPLSPALDTAGFLTRDPILWHAASKVMYGTNISSDYASLPKKILTAGYPTTGNSEANQILVDFLAKLTDFLGAGTPQPLDASALWASSPPAAANGVSLSTLMSLAYPALISLQQWRLLTIPFYRDYAAKFNGKRPFVDPSPLIRWAYGQNSLPADAEQAAIKNATIFKSWWEEKVMLPSKESCSESLLLYVSAAAGTSYRNVYRRFVCPFLFSH